MVILYHLQDLPHILALNYNYFIQTTCLGWGKEKLGLKPEYAFAHFLKCEQWTPKSGPEPSKVQMLPQEGFLKCNIPSSTIKTTNEHLQNLPVFFFFFS